MAGNERVGKRRKLGTQRAHIREWLNASLQQIAYASVLYQVTWIDCWSRMDQMGLCYLCRRRRMHGCALPSSRMWTCNKASAGCDFGVVGGGCELCSWAPGKLALFPHQNLLQTGGDHRRKTSLQVHIRKPKKFFFLSMKCDCFCWTGITWCTLKANLTPWSMSSSSSGLPAMISSSEETLFMYFIASFPVATLIWMYI